MGQEGMSSLAWGDPEGCPVDAVPVDGTFYSAEKE